jgi:hypothetical protein
MTTVAEIRPDRAYSTRRSGHVVLGWQRHPCRAGFPILARLMGRDGKVVQQWFTEDGRWSAGQRSDLDLLEMPPPERRVGTH